MDKTLQYRVADGVGTITLDRPERRNAFTFGMLEGWAAALRHAQDDPAVRVVLVRGSGGSFCAGLDLEEFASMSSAQGWQNALLHTVHRVSEAVEALEKPLIASVDGAAVGAGMDMALMCDLRVASPSARFSQGYVRVGLVPGDGGAYYLPRIVGEQRALELMWSGRFVDAEEARALGIVLEVFERETFDADVEALCRTIASSAPLAVQAIKRLTTSSRTSTLRSSMQQAAAELAVIRSTSDSDEAFAAFREKRTPTFTGS